MPSSRTCSRILSSLLFSSLLFFWPVTAGAETTCEELASRTWFSWTNHPGITSTAFPAGDYINPRSPEPQGDCGTCPYFALVEVAEAKYKIDAKAPGQFIVNFSEWGLLATYLLTFTENLIDQNYI